jgi:6-pyruvoyltetrahydropterin/6-carboxytetrahydropterin synthase
MKTAVYRKEHFNAAHRIFNPNWTNEQNEAFYGKCNNQNYHGHNYELVVKVIGYTNPETGYVIDMKALSKLIKEKVLLKFDHKNLNLDTEEFKNTIASAENIARVIWEILRPHLQPELEMVVYLYETERNYVEYPAK